MPYELPPDPRAARRTRIAGWVTFGFAASLVGLTAYLGYVGYEGSRQLTDAPAPSTDCRTPAVFGWAYEAVNYDLANQGMPRIKDRKLSGRSVQPNFRSELCL